MKLSNAIQPLLRVTLLGCLLGLAPMSAIAATATTTMAVSATVQATCTVSATGMSFGTYAAAVTNTSATVSVTCTNTTGYTIGLSAGLASGATTANRQMTGPGGAVLGYGLFTDSGYTTNWDAVGGTHTVSGTGNGSNQALTVYGQIPAGQYLAPGAYSDTITATVSY